MKKKKPAQKEEVAKVLFGKKLSDVTGCYNGEESKLKDKKWTPL